MSVVINVTIGVVIGVAVRMGTGGSGQLGGDRDGLSCGLRRGACLSSLGHVVSAPSGSVIGGVAAAGEAPTGGAARVCEFMKNSRITDAFTQ